MSRTTRSRCLRFLWTPLLCFVTLAGCGSTGSPFSDRTPQLWSIPLDGFGKVEQADGLLLGMANFSTKDEDRLVAVDLNSREIAWKSEAVNPQSARLVTASTNGYVYAQISQAEGFYVYTAEGDLVNHVVFPDAYESNFTTIRPLLHNNRLYIVNGHHLHAYDLTDPVNPSLAWKITYGDYDFKVTTVDEVGNLYVGMATLEDIDISLKRLDPTDGSLIWEKSTYTEKAAEQSSADAVEVDGDKLIAIAFGTMQAFDKETGERLWVSELLRCSSDGVQTTIAMEIVDAVAYISPRGGSCVFAVDLTDGSMLWMHNAKVVPGAWFTYGGKPKYYNGVVYATNSYLWALDAKTGEVLSLSKIQDRWAIKTYVQEYNGEILVWGEKLRAYKPVR